MFNIFLFLFFLPNVAFAANNPFLPPHDSVVVKDVTELNTAKIGDRIKDVSGREKDVLSKDKAVADSKKDDDKITVKTIKSKMPSLEAKIDNWYIMSTVIQNRNICYIVKYPEEKISNHKESRKPYMMISFVNNKRYEISISAGYKYRNNSIATLSIDGAIFKLSANDHIAWTQGVFEDFNIIQTMLPSFRAMVKSESSVGTYAVDTYDLTGFVEAYNKMISVCRKQ